MNHRLRRLIRERANFRCEYCHLPEEVAELRFQADHIVAEKHGGASLAENLCWACFRCNSHKGPNLAGLDEKTGQMARLFNPRTDTWKEHFNWSGPKLIGRTPVGRVTINVLSMNRMETVLLRRSLLAEGIRF
jgi:hypothetical protein